MRIKYTKRQAVALFGSTTKMAEALGTTRATVNILEKKLTQKTSDEVLGASIRLGLVKVVEIGMSGDR